METVLERDMRAEIITLKTKLAGCRAAEDEIKKLLKENGISIEALREKKRNELLGRR